MDKYLWSWSLLEPNDLYRKLIRDRLSRWYLTEMKQTGIEMDIGTLNAVMGACVRLRLFIREHSAMCFSRSECTLLGPFAVAA